jgi:hypothetical protein
MQSLVDHAANGEIEPKLCLILSCCVLSQRQKCRMSKKAVRPRGEKNGRSCRLQRGSYAFVD